MRPLYVVIALLLCLAPARAEDAPKKPAKKAPPKPLAVEQAADAVLKAVEAKDDKGLKALVAADAVDPWLVADKLCERKTFDAAERFARAVAKPETSKLTAYVTARRTADPETELRKLFQQGLSMLAKDPAAVLASTEGRAGNRDTVPRLHIARLRGVALGRQRAWLAGAEEHAQAGKGARALGWSRFAITLYQDAARYAERGGAFAQALRTCEVCLELARELKSPRGEVFSFGTTGLIHYRRGENVEAETAFEKALEVAEKNGLRAMATTTIANLGLVYRRLGDLPQARQSQERALVLYRDLDSKLGEAQVHANLGAIFFSLGDLPRALAMHKRALVLHQELGNERELAQVWSDIGSTLRALGDFPPALTALERSVALYDVLGDPPARGTALNNLGAVHADIGNKEQALGLLRRAASIFEKAKMRYHVVMTRQNLAVMAGQMGRTEEKAAELEKVRPLAEELKAPLLLAGILRSLADNHETLGRLELALALQERALALAREGGMRADAARSLGSIGALKAKLGRVDEGLRDLSRAVREARRLRHPDVAAVTHVRHAGALLDAGKPARALSAAHKGLDVLESLSGGLGELGGANIRARWSVIFDFGSVAAARVDEPAEMLTFLESGRASALLESLGGRRALRWSELPEELRRSEAEAKAAQSRARKAYDRSLRAGNRRALRAKAQDLDDATDRLRAVMNRIQRDAKKQAGLFYPRAATLEDVEAGLGSHEVLVFYALGIEETRALVLRQDGERIVELGKRADVEAACRALIANDPDVDPTKQLAALRKLLVEPLKLKDDVKQVLVSPEGALCYLPFAALFDQTVCMTPSGTTHLLLLDEEREPGLGVLALGDPDYAGASEAAQKIYYRGRTLSPLGATRPEAEKIGTVKLLGDKATEAGLKEALAKQKRWKAVHLACHGLIDVERPMLSSLALTRADEDDGFLTALEVLRMKIPADLAVLSACETGTGKVVKGEGIVGLTRAFMFAGAPRVICSLWKVDDEATKALMLKFYELWNPKEGRGLGAAEALNQAQAFVRSQEKWKHAYYWAAWVLWGLPQ